MVDHGNIERLEGGPHALGQDSVRRAGLCDPGRVVVGNDQGGSVQRERAFCDLARVDGGLAYRALEEHFGGEQPVLAVQEQTHKVLALPILEPE